MKIVFKILILIIATSIYIKYDMDCYSYMLGALTMFASILVDEIWE